VGSVIQTDELNQAIELIKAGDKNKAIPILKEILKTDRNNELAWLWLAYCVETTDDKIFCFREALRINPNNVQTKKALEQLEPNPTIQPPIISKPKYFLGGQLSLVGIYLCLLGCIFAFTGSIFSSGTYQSIMLNIALVGLGMLILGVLLYSIGRNISLHEHEHLRLKNQEKPILEPPKQAATIQKPSTNRNPKKRGRSKFPAKRIGTAIGRKIIK
jgi:tetratricopeptide (TPR) repeat protein